MVVTTVILMKCTADEIYEINLKVNTFRHSKYVITNWISFVGLQNWNRVFFK